MAKVKRVKKKTPTRKPRAKAKAKSLAGTLDVHAPERRKENFFVRLKKSNSDWIKAQADKQNLPYSEYTDLLFDKLRVGSHAVQA